MLVVVINHIPYWKTLITFVVSHKKFIQISNRKSGNFTV